MRSAATIEGQTNTYLGQCLTPKKKRSYWVSLKPLWRTGMKMIFWRTENLVKEMDRCFKDLCCTRLQFSD